MQDAEVGDGTTSVVLIAAELLRVRFVHPLHPILISFIQSRFGQFTQQSTFSRISSFFP
jgi:hypothetical protein